MSRHDNFIKHWHDIGRPEREYVSANTYSIEWRIVDAGKEGWYGEFNYRIAGDPHWELRQKWIDSGFTLPIESKAMVGPWRIDKNPCWYADVEYREAKQVNDEFGDNAAETRARAELDRIEARTSALDVQIVGDYETDPIGKSQNQPGAKLDAGKIRPSLILSDMPMALLAVAEVGTFGAKKYSDGGWLSVPDGIKRYTDAMDRHRLKGSFEPVDADSGLPHAAHLAWNALARLELMLNECNQKVLLSEEQVDG